MNYIKFAKGYPKLTTINRQSVVDYIGNCRLLEVLPVELADLSAEFLDYDTASGSYDLPKKGKYLLLIMQKPGGVDLLTTLRRWTPQKEAYYRALIGERFYIIFTHQPAAER